MEKKHVQYNESYGLIFQLSQMSLKKSIQERKLNKLCLIFVSVHSDTSNSDQYGTHNVAKKFQLERENKFFIRYSYFGKISSFLTLDWIGRARSTQEDSRLF